MAIMQHEASWDATNKEVVYTRRTVPENITVYNICSSMFASGGGLSDSQWFVAEGTGSTTSGITCGSGVRNLILCDDAAITINEGFFVNEGSTLHIYCQSYDERMGKLVSNNTVESWPGIGGKEGYMGMLVIHGGDIRAKGGQYAAGIGGREDKPNGPIIIYGGKIDATGGENGAGIGGGEGGSLTIKKGGQLLHNNLTENLWVTVEKSISHYTVASGAGNTDGWHFIASPIYTGFTPDETMLSNTFDLYRFNPSAELEWENYKAHDDFTELVRGQGYLYANNTDVTLNFTGHLIPYKSVV